jgi:hypothetical protein
MTTEPASRHTLILGAVLLASATLLGLGVFALFQRSASEVTAASESLAAYRAELAQRPRLEAEFARTKTREESAAGLLHGASGPLAAAELQRVVKDVITGCGGDVHSAQNLPPSQRSGLETVEVQYELTLPLATLKRAIYRLETATPYLFLDHVDLKVWEAPQPSTTPPTIQVQWIVRGYRWTGKS